MVNAAAKSAWCNLSGLEFTLEEAGSMCHTNMKHLWLHVSKLKHRHLLEYFSDAKKPNETKSQETLKLEIQVLLSCTVSPWILGLQSSWPYTVVVTFAIMIYLCNPFLVLAWFYLFSSLNRLKNWVCIMGQIDSEIKLCKTLESLILQKISNWKLGRVSWKATR